MMSARTIMPKKRRSIVLHRPQIEIQYCIILLKSLPINHPGRFVLLKPKRIFRNDNGILVPCDSQWLKKAFKIKFTSRPLVRYCVTENCESKSYVNAFLCNYFEHYAEAKEEVTRLNKGTPSQGRGKRTKIPTNKNFTPTLVCAKKRKVNTKQITAEEKKKAAKEMKEKKEAIMKSKRNEENIIAECVESANNKKYDSKVFVDCPRNEIDTVTPEGTSAIFIDSTTPFDTRIHCTENKKEGPYQKSEISMMPTTASEFTNKESPDELNRSMIECNSTVITSCKATNPKSIETTKVDITHSSPVTLKVNILRHCHSQNDDNGLINDSSDITVPSKTNEMNEWPTPLSSNSVFVKSTSSMDSSFDASPKNKETCNASGQKSVHIPAPVNRPRITSIQVIQRRNDDTEFEDNDNISSEIMTPPNNDEADTFGNKSSGIDGADTIVSSTPRVPIQKKLSYTSGDAEKGKDLLETPFHTFESFGGPSHRSDNIIWRNKNTRKNRPITSRMLSPKDSSDCEHLAGRDSSDTENEDTGDTNALIAKLKRRKDYYKQKYQQIIINDTKVPSKKKKNRGLNDKVEDILSTVSKLLAIADNNNNSDDNVIDILKEKPSDDGKIIFNNHTMDSELLCSAIHASDMKKRCNKVINALWTKDEQLKLALRGNENKRDSGYKNLTNEEIATVAKTCRDLQRMQHLPMTGRFDIQKNHRKWISDHLKHNREMNAPENREGYLKRKQRTNAKRKNQITTSERRKKMRRTEASSPIEEYHDHNDDNDDGVNLNFQKFRNLLTPMIYKGINGTDTIKEDKMITRKEISDKINVDEEVVNTILTRDSCVVIEDCYYFPVDFEYEVCQLYNVLTQLKSLDEPGTKLKLSEIHENLKGFDNYDEKITNYIFEKYTVPIGKGKNKKTDQYYSFRLNKICHALLIYILEYSCTGSHDKKTYRSVLDECKKLPYCDNYTDDEWTKEIVENCIVEKDEITGKPREDGLIRSDGGTYSTLDALMIIYQDYLELLD